MNWGLFESFCEMLEGIPIKAVIRAADAERRMVEEDLKKKRADPDECVVSVLGFCNFLTLAVRGIYASLASLPAEHRAFYARIVQQLADAGELPAEIKGHFGQIFSTGKSDALRSAQGKTNQRFA
jgi:hypothetical protein